MHSILSVRIAWENRIANPKYFERWNWPAPDRLLRKGYLAGSSAPARCEGMLTSRDKEIFKFQKNGKFIFLKILRELLSNSCSIFPRKTGLGVFSNQNVCNSRTLFRNRFQAVTHLFRIRTAGSPQGKWAESKWHSWIKKFPADPPMTCPFHTSWEISSHFQIPRLRSAEFVFHPPEYALQIQESLIDELYELQRGFQCVGKLMFLCRAATCPSRNPTLLWARFPPWRKWTVPFPLSWSDEYIFLCALTFSRVYPVLDACWKKPNLASFIVRFHDIDDWAADGSKTAPMIVQSLSMDSSGQL